MNGISRFATLVLESELNPHNHCVNSAYPGAERSRTEHVTSRSHDAVCVGLYESNSAFTYALIGGRAAPRQIVTLNVGIPCFRGCLQPICIACEVHDELS